MVREHWIEAYIERVYGYAVRNTYSREEADELSQEILLTAIRELPKLRDESRFEPWLWRLAANVTAGFRRFMGKQRAMFVYNAPYEAVFEEPWDDEQEEYEEIRRRVAMLSRAYREIIILYYYDGLSVKEISKRMNLPEGTITWRLSEARKKLRKEWTEMRESALRPVRMKIDIYGSGDYDGKRLPFPSEYIKDALSQNILYYCSEGPQGIEELAQKCGVPAYYVEERMENLVWREAVIESAKGKYQTDFIVWTDRHGKFCEENAERFLAPVIDDMLDALRAVAEEAEKLTHYRADKSAKDLFYLYGVLAMDHACRQYGRIRYPEIGRRYDGNRWRYIGSTETGAHRRLGLGHQKNLDLGSRSGYIHEAYGGIKGISFRQMMDSDLLGVCADVLSMGNTADIDVAARAIEAGYIIRHKNGEMRVTVPAFTKMEKQAFDAIAEKYLAPLMESYNRAVEAFAEGYMKLFPAHLKEDAERMCQNVFMDMYAVIVEHGQRTGAIELPSEGCVCDVMYQ